MASALTDQQAHNVANAHHQLCTLLIGCNSEILLIPALIILIGDENNDQNSQVVASSANEMFKLSQNRRHGLSVAYVPELKCFLGVHRDLMDAVMDAKNW